MGLRHKCYKLMEAQGHPEPTGQAKVTPGYNLPAARVLHAVGPIIETGQPSKAKCKQLASCYRSSLELTLQNRIGSIVSCCISTGDSRETMINSPR